ncbi:MAG: hypothetical protein AAF318_12690 [Pseudomonadota bacterium]
MATVEVINQRLETLRAERAKGRRRVRFGDREIEYRHDNEMAAAIADLERQLQEATTGRLPRILNIRSNKGWT